MTITDPVERLRVLAALTSNVVAQRGAHDRRARRPQHRRPDHHPGRCSASRGLLASLLLAFALIVATRRQTAHFRSLVTLLHRPRAGLRRGRLPLREPTRFSGCSASERELLGDGVADFVHPDDRALLEAAAAHGEPAEIVFRMRNRFGEWRHLEAHVTDLRDDRRTRAAWC